MTPTTSLSHKSSFNYDLRSVAVSSPRWGDDDAVAHEPWVVGVISSARVLLAVLGSLANIITIRTFSRMGIRDTVNLTLVWLAASDLCFLVSGVAGSVALIFNAVEGMTSYRLWFPVDPRAVHSVATITGSGSYANTMLITTFITVARCLIVAKPLRFRNVLPWRPTAIVMAVFSSVSVATVIILLGYLRFLPQFDSRIDTVRPTLWFPPERKIVKDVIFGLRDAALPFVSQICVSVCVFIMASCLRKATHFRSVHTTNREFKKIYLNSASMVTKIIRNLNSNTKLSTLNSVAAAENSPALIRSLAGKELKVVRQMLIIASVYSVCNMPKVIVNLLEVALPGFSAGQRYHAWYDISQIARELFQTVNATVTFGIYWSFNSKFRETLRSYIC